MDPVEFFEGLARVLDAGAKACRSTPFNVQRSLQAETYDAMAEEARAVVRSIEGRHD